MASKPQAQWNEDRLSFTEFEALRNDLKESGKLHFRVVSGSMAPLIPVHSVIDVSPLTEGELRRFDIIVFFKDDRLISHFIWWKNHWPSPTGSSTYTTGGLRGLDDVVVNDESILGKVVHPILSRRDRLRLVGRHIWRRFSRRFLGRAR